MEEEIIHHILSPQTLPQNCKSSLVSHQPQFTQATPQSIHCVVGESTRTVYSSSSSGQTPLISTIMSQSMAPPVQSVLMPGVTPGSYSQNTPTISNIANIHGTQKGVIYAFTQYSPFISIPSSTGNHYSHLALNDSENSDLGPEDVAEVQHMINAGTVSAPASSHEYSSCSYSGKCQSGGELRLSELSEKLNTLTVPDGFCLVGAKSPMLPGVTLVAVVDKRYLPGDSKAITMLGFSGNCIGCGASGFRYFTEFSSHINLKLATQPKKQKHLKYYIVKNQDSKWVRGPLIPWKGTETRKRIVPSHSLQMFGRTPEVVPSVTKANKREKRSTSLIVSSIMNESENQPEVKKVRTSDERKVIYSLIGPSATKTESGVFLTDCVNKELPLPDTNPEIAFKLPASAVCGVRPVLLLCQHISCKLPSSINDIIISDLLVDCFDLPSSFNHPAATTSSTCQPTNKPVMSSGASYNAIDSKTGISHVEQNAANMLITMRGNTNSEQSQSLESWEKFSESIFTQKRDFHVSLTAAIIIFTQYLCSLDDTCISKDQVELLLNKAGVDLQNSVDTTSSLTVLQLIYIINLQCSASDGRVRLITSNSSFQNGLYKTLRWVHETFYVSTMSKKKLKIPNFVMILSTPPSGQIEFGVLVTGITHAKILAECLGIGSIVQSLNSKPQNGRTQFKSDLLCLGKQFQQTNEAIGLLIKMYESARENMVYVPFNAYAGMRVRHSQAQEYEPTVAPISAEPSNTKGIFSNQSSMAQQLLTQLKTIAENPAVLDLPSFLKVELLIVVPPIISLYYLTVKRLCESSVLSHLGLETEDNATNCDIAGRYVITYSDWPESISRWHNFVKSAKGNRDTLFLLIFDQAQRYSLPRGMPDVLPNLKDVFESPNVVLVFVTSVPYMFQTRKSFIDPDNEVYWTDGRRTTSSKNSDVNFVTINDRDMIYFGLKEYCASTRWHQQYSLIRHEDAFDVAVPKANRLNDVKYSMVQGYVLLRLYQASLMVAGGIKPAEPYAAMSVIRMVNDIVESPLHNADGSGYMLLLRIPDKRFGKYFHDVLLETRNSIGFQYRFDLIYDDGDRELQIGDYFLKRMQKWKLLRGWSEEKAKHWRPRCLEELLDLPCMFILSGEERSGETFPRSLKYADFNILNYNNFHRSTIEAEIGSLACHLSVNAANNSDIAAKPMVMNNVRCGVGTTYLDNWKMKYVKDDASHDISHDANGRSSRQCDGCLTKDHLKKHVDSCIHFSSKYPLPVFLVSKPLWSLMQSEYNQMLVHLNPDPNTQWTRSHRPLLNTTKPDRLSRHYRRWTDAKPARKDLTTPGSSPRPASPNGKHVEDKISQLFTIANHRSEKSTGHCPGGDEEQIDDHEDKDNEDTDKERYHPRCLLLSGPPQAGKTGAYLHFAYILHRMLIRLKRVDVYDNYVTYTSTHATNALTENYEDLKVNFVSGYLDYKYEYFSTVHLSSTLEGDPEQVVSRLREEGESDALVILSKTASYTALHHCEICRFYRDCIAITHSSLYFYQLNDFGKKKVKIDLNLIIPPMHLKHFIINEKKNTVLCLILQLHGSGKQTIEGAPMKTVKTPIFMLSSTGEEEGLLNLFHSMEGSEHVHITFIRASEAQQYQKHWPNHVFVVLPEVFNTCSDSAIKNIVKAFALQNYVTETDRTRASHGTLWPFVLMLPDNLVMWQKLGNSIADSSESESEGESSNGRKRAVERMASLRDTTSLFDLLTSLESSPNLMDCGLIGIRPWSSYQDEVGLPYRLKTFVHSFLLLNVDRTKSISFSKNVFLGEDIDFQLKLINEKIPIYRFEHFTFMAKVTSRTCWRGQDDVSNVDTFSSLVVQPDMEKNYNLFKSSPHSVLQTYLSLAGSTLFPMAVNKPEFPVLVIGPYLNLGSEIKVCVFNCHSDIQLNGIPSCTKAFAGLVIYNCSNRLTKDFLRQFKFIKDSQVVFVCKQRGKLRAEIVRLDLEDSWRFRLRDEYQTATCMDKMNPRSLFFLTGSYTP